MFDDPLTLNSDWSTITVNAAGNFDFSAIERAADHSLYRFQDTGAAGPVTWDLAISHQFARRNRVTARLTVSSLMADLLVPDRNSQFSSSCYVVVDTPPSGAFEPYSSPVYATPLTMYRLIGGLLISVGSAETKMHRVVLGET